MVDFVSPREMLLDFVSIGSPCHHPISCVALGLKILGSVFFVTKSVSHPTGHLPHCAQLLSIAKVWYHFLLAIQLLSEFQFFTHILPHCRFQSLASCQNHCTRFSSLACIHASSQVIKWVPEVTSNFILNPIARFDDQSPTWSRLPLL